MKIAYTIKERAEALGCGMNKSYDLVHSGEIQSFKIGKKIMIPAHAVEKFIHDQTSIYK